MASAKHKEVETILQKYTPEEIVSDDRFCKVLKEYLTEGSQPSEVITILHKLEECIMMLKSNHKPLVKSIINMKWLDNGPEVTKVYTSFILNLVSVHVEYFKPLLNVLVKKMREDYQVSEIEDEQSKVQICLKREQDFNDVHSLLKSLCKLIPMTTIMLVPILDETFPYIDKEAEVFENYVNNLLKITWYLPNLRMDILDIIVKRMLKFDVRISRDALTDVYASEEGSEDHDDEDMFSMEMDADNVTEQKVESDVKSQRVAESEVKHKLLLAQAASLDAIMNVVLNFIRETCFPQGVLDWAVTKQLYRELLSSFDKYVFQTHLSSHTPFIMFYICSFKKPLVDGFVDYLWKKVTNPVTQPIFRQIAACYIGSFLARAKYIHISTTKTIVGLMMQWVHNYLDQTCDVSRQPGIEHHSAFYSVCQACFYVFCFKHTEFYHMPKGEKWASSLNFQRVVTSNLNPLKYCSPLIVNTFSSATRTYQLAFCDTIIERNNRYRLPVSTVNSFDSLVDKHLHAFFPFDPYLLKKSCSFITPLYQEFQGNLSEDVIDSEGEDDFLPQDVHLKPHEDKNAIDLLHYSCSPGFQYADMASL